MKAALSTVLAATFGALAPNPAVACGQPFPPEPIAAAELDRIAAQEIAESDAIIDARVERWVLGGVVLKPVRVLKGAKQSRYHVAENSCDGPFPRPGALVRVLLTRSSDSDPWWMAHDPALGGRLDDYRRLDRAIDRRLGTVRPRNYATIASLDPPPPISSTPR